MRGKRAPSRTSMIAALWFTGVRSRPPRRQSGTPRRMISDRLHGRAGSQCHHFSPPVRPHPPTCFPAVHLDMIRQDGVDERYH